MNHVHHALSDMFSRNLFTVVVATTLFALFKLFKSFQSYKSLRHIPGPKAAALTNLVRRSWAKSGRIHETHLRVHQEYGSVVRVGPNAVLVSQPRAIDSIFGFTSRAKKSEFYNALMPRMKGGPIPDVFATLDEDVHRQMRRPVANLYSIGNLVSFEPLITSTLRHLFMRLDERFTDREDTAFDMYDWLQFFTFDVIGEVTFSRRLGFLDAGGDIEGVIEANWNYFKAAAPNTQMPWLDYLWKDNPLLLGGSKKNLVAEFSFARIHERMSLTPDQRESINQRDFLSCFIREKEKDSALPASAVPTWTNSNIQAGVDTTSILESALFYHLLKNPATLATLRAEIDAAAKAGRISDFVSWKESQTLPYLEACIHEASRLHPPICFPIERVVGKQGLRIDGFAIPPGTRVSMVCVYDKFYRDAGTTLTKSWG
ncbi:hypothetical protein NX059_009864 [Plenodomus lindquistii]|nr:hypothetical protein NX059_009864 [Plenodomus lindquistii]